MASTGSTTCTCTTAVPGPPSAWPAGRRRTAPPSPVSAGRSCYLGPPRRGRPRLGLLAVAPPGDGAGSVGVADGQRERHGAQADGGRGQEGDAVGGEVGHLVPVHDVNRASEHDDAGQHGYADGPTELPHRVEHRRG